MSTVNLKGEPFQTSGEFLKAGQKLPALRLIKSDLSTLDVESLRGKKVIFNIFPSVDTSVCATSLREFSSRLKDREDIVLLFASMDLPFALNRFCAAEGIANAITTSDYRHQDLANHGAKLIEGPLEGLYARACMVIDEDQNIVHSELVSDIVEEPNYEAALQHV